jgi:hypothetical protein
MSAAVPIYAQHKLGAHGFYARMVFMRAWFLCAHGFYARPLHRLGRFAYTKPCENCGLK